MSWPGEYQKVNVVVFSPDGYSILLADPGDGRSWTLPSNSYYDCGLGAGLRAVKNIMKQFYGFDVLDPTPIYASDRTENGQWTTTFSVRAFKLCPSDIFDSWPTRWMRWSDLMGLSESSNDYFRALQDAAQRESSY